MSEQITLFSDNPEYDAFVEKFKPKKTTDDCYTPDGIYNVVLEWVRNEYNIRQTTSIVRPFWPGGNYEKYDYPAGCVVVDNPPFSIRAQIIDFYLGRNIRFFLFSPALTLFTRRPGVCHIATGATITYANGAIVPTSFVTNLEDCVLRTAPDLFSVLEKANKDITSIGKKELPKYIYPDNIITAAIAQRWCHYGIEYRLSASDCVYVSALDEQKKTNKSIFGYGLLLSERAAAERAAAERWTLSTREKEIIKKLDKRKEEKRHAQDR